jgi:SM-20-related protein
MTQLAYDRLAAAPVAPEPYRHVIVPAFVPPAVLARVVADLPPLERRGSFPVGSLRFGPDAAALMEELEGPEFRRAIADKFSLNLDDAPTMLTLRGSSTERDGLIHRDSDAKRVTILLYLNPATEAWARHEGCLRLLRTPDDLDDFAVEVPPADGALLVFPNARNAWHGHKTFIGRRYVAQLNYMTTDSAARSELRRHRFSALVKRLTMAA